jgi:hypothetical protein
MRPIPLRRSGITMIWPTLLSLSFRLLTILFSAGLSVPAAGLLQLHTIIGDVEFGPFSASNVSFSVVLGLREQMEVRLSATEIRYADAFAVQRPQVICGDGLLSATLVSCIGGHYRVEHPALGLIEGDLAFHYRADTGAFQAGLADVRIGDTIVAGALVRSPAEWGAEFIARGLPLEAARMLGEPLELWPAGYTGESGTLDVAIRLRGAPGRVESAEGVVRADSVGIFGASSAEDLTLEAEFSALRTGGWNLAADGRLTAGAVYIEPGLVLGDMRPGFAVLIEEEPVTFSVDGAWSPSGAQLTLRHIHYRHPGVVAVDGRGEFDLTEGFSVRNADVRVAAAGAGPLYETYLQPLLLQTSFDVLDAAGSIEADIRIDGGELRDLDLRLTDVHVYDRNGRFSVAGLDGGLRISAADFPVPSHLNWAGIGVYRLALGPGELELESAQGDLRILRWQDVPILGGALRIDALRLEDAGRRNTAVLLDGELTPVSMADFTQAIGWPVMSGELQASLRGLSYRRGTLVMDGDIEVGLFDGQVRVRNLRIDDLFGLVPVLRADVDVERLDLALLTDRFSFGRIEGRLSGHVHRLELQSWQPVYFEAAFETPADDNSRHRISQKAVDNLGFIGGGSTSALSGGFLRFFQEYSYGRIGLSCRLYNGACELGGVEDTADGFLILTRGGLLPPWIEVKGTGRGIEWNTLVDGLKRITEGGVEIR